METSERDWKRKTREQWRQRMQREGAFYSEFKKWGQTCAEFLRNLATKVYYAYPRLQEAEYIEVVRQQFLVRITPRALKDCLARDPYMSLEEVVKEALEWELDQQQPDVSEELAAEVSEVGWTTSSVSSVSSKATALSPRQSKPALKCSGSLRRLRESRSHRRLRESRSRRRLRESRSHRRLRESRSHRHLRESCSHRLREPQPPPPEREEPPPPEREPPPPEREPPPPLREREPPSPEREVPQPLAESPQPLTESLQPLIESPQFPPRELGPTTAASERVSSERERCVARASERECHAIRNPERESAQPPPPEREEPPPPEREPPPPEREPPPPLREREPPSPEREVPQPLAESPQPLTESLQPLIESPQFQPRELGPTTAANDRIENSEPSARERGTAEEDHPQNSQNSQAHPDGDMPFCLDSVGHNTSNVLSLPHSPTVDEIDRSGTEIVKMTEELGAAELECSDTENPATVQCPVAAGAHLDKVLEHESALNSPADLLGSEGDHVTEGDLVEDKDAVTANIDVSSSEVTNNTTAELNSQIRSPLPTKELCQNKLR
ncbi:UNVERIFIED_CONTAM: hypothetical protein FKN15_055130 [Acipenser sinensis]